MTPEDEIRTAKAVHYRKFERPATVTKGDPNSPPFSAKSPTSSWYHETRRYPKLHPTASLWWGDEGRETYVSCLQRGFGVDMARRVVEWERDNPTKRNGLSPTDRYQARNIMPWDVTLPRPNTTPAMVQPPPYPPSSSSGPPPVYQYPVSTYPYVAENTSSRPPVRKMKKLNLRSSTTSPPPLPSCEVVENHFKKIEKAETRIYPPVSYLTETFRREERYKQEAQERLERRRKEQVEEKEASMKKRLEDVPDYIKDLARSWRQKYPGPDKVFRKDFDFGPKAHINEDDDYQRPLSPCTSHILLQDVCLEPQSKSLKRQRHDSSNTDVARESPHDRLQTASSSTPIPRAPATVQISMSFLKSIGAPEPYPGQLVHHNLMDEPRLEIQRSDAGTTTSDYNLNDVIDRFEPIPSSQEDSWTANKTQAVHRDSCCGDDFRLHLETVFSQQGKLRDTADEAQAAVDKAIRMKTCGIQRKARTMRDHAPDLFQSLSNIRAAEPQITGWPTPPDGLTHTLTLTSTAEHRERRKSYVAKFRSTDVLLRDVRESHRIRQLMEEAKQAHRPRQDAPDPRSPKVEDDWLGDDPL
ncbi:hypothetical protein E8E11_001373 [Didymella keratinophila]|nr:hypothetical protein E8E11_001373 [Didymella keratinophila]